MTSTSSSSVSCFTFSLVISGLSSCLRGLIWSSLCFLSPLPMVLVSCASAKSSFPSCSWYFLDCNESSIHISLIYLQMISTNISVLISSPWSTDRKKNPLSSFLRREPIKGACFPLSAALRTLALCFSAPKTPRWPPLTWRSLILLLRLLCLGSIPLLIPDLLCQSHWIYTDPHQSSSIWHLSITCQSNDCAWLPYGFLVLPCHQYDSLTPCLSHFWLLTPPLTHSLTKHADWCAYSFLYSAMTHSPYAYSYMLIPCLLINYKAPIVLLPIPYQFPLLIWNTMLPPIYIKPLELRGAQEKSPPSIAWHYSTLSLSLSVFLYSLSLVGFSASLKASVFKSIQDRKSVV